MLPGKNALSRGMPSGRMSLFERCSSLKRCLLENFFGYTTDQKRKAKKKGESGSGGGYNERYYRIKLYLSQNLFIAFSKIDFF